MPKAQPANQDRASSAQRSPARGSNGAFGTKLAPDALNLAPGFRLSDTDSYGIASQKPAPGTPTRSHFQGLYDRIRA
jgi:hypothetical protein